MAAGLAAPQSMLLCRVSSLTLLSAAQRTKQVAELHALQLQLEGQLADKVAEADAQQQASTAAAKKLAAASQRLADKTAQYDACVLEHKRAIKDKCDTITGLELELASVMDELASVRMAHQFDKSKLVSAQVLPSLCLPLHSRQGLTCLCSRCAQLYRYSSASVVSTSCMGTLVHCPPAHRHAKRAARCIMAATALGLELFGLKSSLCCNAYNFWHGSGQAVPKRC